MAESLDNGEFWLPPQFLLDDDTVHMEKYSANNLKNLSAKDVFGYPETEYGKSLIPYEFPYGFGSFGFSSDLSSPVESVVGSTETESDEEDYLAGLSRQMSHFTLEDDFKRNDLPCGTEKTKGWVLSGSPQSTLCAVGSRCGCEQGSSRGSPNGSSPPATRDLLFEAAGEVERMRMNNEKGYCFNSQSRGLSGPPRKPLPISTPSENPNCDVSLYQQQQSLAYQKLQASQLGRQVMQQQQHQQHQHQQQSVWGGQSNIKGTGVLFPQMPQQTHPGVQNRGRNITSVGRGPLGLSASAWPPLQNITHPQPQPQQQLQQQNSHGVSGMRAVFLGNPGGKRECAGTGGFPTSSNRYPNRISQEARVLHCFASSESGPGSQLEFGRNGGSGPVPASF
ncbi:TIP41-LIKE PROTEIN [Salix purpurea]|uniref:TIP41-LIKE PROTEIN n=1 Tax=Salix purpurea TaxID=77065 RepID=A0A9Q1A2G5_SALPP|nr:TIP41-LIKE PROTEIN [Salix purpurea]